MALASCTSNARRRSSREAASLNWNARINPNSANTAASTAPVPADAALEIQTIEPDPRLASAAAEFFKRKHADEQQYGKTRARPSIRET